MSEPTAETSTEPSPFDAVPVTYEPPVAERRQLADDAMEILLRGRQRTPFGTTKVTAQEVITLAEYLRTGLPLSPDTSPKLPPYTLISVKSVALGDVFLNVANTESVILAPPRIDFQSVQIKARQIENGDVHNPTYDLDAQLRIVRRAEPAELVNTETIGIMDARIGDVVLTKVSGNRIKIIKTIPGTETMIGCMVRNIDTPGAGEYPFTWARDARVQVLLPRPSGD